MLGAAFSDIAVYVVSWLAIAGLTGLTSTVLTVYVLKSRLRDLEGQIASLWERTGRHREELGRLDREKLKLEADTAKEYATHAALGRVLADAAQGRRDVMERLDAVHGRISTLAQLVAQLQGGQDKKVQT
jgi:chromosome segregation ATPase